MFTRISTSDDNRNEKIILANFTGAEIWDMHNSGKQDSAFTLLKENDAQDFTDNQLRLQTRNAIQNIVLLFDKLNKYDASGQRL